MYRIHFSAYNGCWVIQMKEWVFFWSNVLTRSHEVLAFDDYQAARDHVAKLGLEKVYRDAATLKRKSEFKLPTGSEWHKGKFGIPIAPPGLS